MKIEILIKENQVHDILHLVPSPASFNVEMQKEKESDFILVSEFWNQMQNEIIELPEGYNETIDPDIFISKTPIESNQDSDNLPKYRYFETEIEWNSGDSIAIIELDFSEPDYRKLIEFMTEGMETLISNFPTLREEHKRQQLLVAETFLMQLGKKLDLDISIPRMPCNET